MANHPKWHPEITEPSQRAALFAIEFPEFFGSAKTAPRRTPPQQRPISGARATVAAIPGAHFCPTCGGPVEVTYHAATMPPAAR